MSLRENKAVSVRVLRVLRINVHFFKIQICENLSRGERSARMAGFCRVHSDDNAFADFIRRLLQFQCIHVKPPVCCGVF